MVINLDKIKKIILMGIPMSICNFRCHYCYLAQRDESFQGCQPVMKYSPQQVATALSKERVGGVAFINMCADGETLLTKDIDLYAKELCLQGHYVELVTNLTITSALDKILMWDKELLKHLEFKCSFHYLELKKKKLLNVFAENVNKIWAAGASANIEVTPSDELIPCIDELKEFSMIHFGALPHLTIARNDRTENIERLTKLSYHDYIDTWKQFDSEFWNYKNEIFGVRQNEFCYAGKWSLYVDLSSGKARQCYCGESLGDIFANLENPISEIPICKCRQPHCYNGHALMTLGLIPYATNVRYGDIRNRVKTDRKEWLQPELKSFFNSQLVETNCELTDFQKFTEEIKCNCAKLKKYWNYGKNAIKNKL